MSEPRKFTKVVVLFNERTHRNKERKWARLKSGWSLMECVYSLLYVASELDKGTPACEIIHLVAVKPGGYTREQLELAWVVAEKITGRKTDIEDVGEINAWTIQGNPEKLVINVKIHKTRVRHRKEKEERGSGG